MPRGSRASVAAKKVSSSNTTHVLLQTDEGLIAAAKQQIESVGKENLVIGMTTILINGRKRTRGTIVCLGSSAECEQTRKTISSSYKETSDEPIQLKKSTALNVRNCQTANKKVREEQTRNSISTTTVRHSKIVPEQRQKSTTSLAIDNAKTKKINHDAQYAETIDDEIVECKGVGDSQSRLVEKAKAKPTKMNKRTYDGEQEQPIVKRKPDNRSSNDINRESTDCLTSGAQLSGTSIAPDSDEDETPALVIDHLSDGEVSQHNQSSQRKTTQKEKQAKEKRSLNKCPVSKNDEASGGKALLTKTTRKIKESAAKVATLNRQIDFLKNQLETMQRETIPLPIGENAKFILQLADRIRSRDIKNGQLDPEEADDIRERLADISDLLGVDEDELDRVRHPTDITKTVRQLTKLVFPDVNKRQNMRISTMNPKVIQAIIDYGRFSHPFAPNNIDLRGHIGNVFAIDRQKTASQDEGVQSSGHDNNEQVSDEEPNENHSEGDE